METRITDTLSLPHRAAVGSPEAGEDRKESARSSQFGAAQLRKLRRLGRAARARGWLGHPVTGAVEVLGRRFLGRLGSMPDSVRESVAVIPQRMHLAANQTSLVIELLDDVRSGVYRQLPWRSIAIASAAVLYSLNPADVIPNVIPVLGVLDDITLIAVAVRLIQRDLRAYCRFKGYREDEYFESADRRRAGAGVLHGKMKT